MKKTKDPLTQDSKVWEEFIKNPKGIFDKEEVSNEKKNKLIFKFDLHGFTLDEANQKVKELIMNSSEKKYSELLLITGKGIHSNIEEDVFKSTKFGKLKFSIPNYIKSEKELNDKIISINSAPKNLGGEGALLVKLKKL